LFLGIFVCSPSGNHHEVDLAKSGYNPNMKDFNHHSIFLAIHTENRIQKYRDLNLLLFSLGD
jgi:hypothetical protein